MSPPPAESCSSPPNDAGTHRECQRKAGTAASHVEPDTTNSAATGPHAPDRLRVTLDQSRQVCVLANVSFALKATKLLRP